MLGFLQKMILTNLLDLAAPIGFQTVRQPQGRERERELRGGGKDAASGEGDGWTGACWS